MLKKQTQSQKNQLLLLEDVENIGRSGDVVAVKPGFARNYLLPQKKAVVADKFTLRLQAKLQEERLKRAIVDKKESEEVASRIEGMVLIAEVKVDPDGNMYGSVSALDIAHLFEKQGIKIERRQVQLLQGIKTLGDHSIKLKLKEGVPASFTLQVVSESSALHQQEEKQEAPVAKEPAKKKKSKEPAS